MTLRKFTLSLLIAPLLFTAASVIAQPTVPGSAFPVAGSVFTLTLTDTTGVVAGSGGANAVWNFGSLTANGATQVDSFLAPSATRYGGLFPSADIAVHEINPATNFFIYYKNDAADGVYQRVANVQPDTVTYTDLPNEYPYPLTYGRTYSDVYHAANLHNNVTNGNLSASVDGYGSLTTPAGTYTNTIRMRASRIEHDTIHAGPNTVPVLADYEYYVWYQPDAYYPIFSITTTTITSSVVNRYAKAVGYRQGYASPNGINDLTAADNAVMLYPNPASQKATLLYNMTERGSSQISVYDMSGRMLQSNTNTTSEGMQTYTLDIAALPMGVYDVRIVNAGNTISKKLQVIK